MSNTFPARVMNDTMWELSQADVRKVRSDSLWNVDAQSFWRQYAGNPFYDNQPSLPQHVAVSVERPADKPCVYLSEEIRENKTTGIPEGTTQTCNHPNHEALIILRETLFRIITELQLLRTQVAPKAEDIIQVIPPHPIEKELRDGTLRALPVDTTAEHKLKHLTTALDSLCAAAAMSLRIQNPICEYQSNTNKFTKYGTS